MTPQERQLVDDLFDRLAKLESAPRDPDATAAIAQGLRTRPTRSMRWCRRCWCRTRRSGAPTAASRNWKRQARPSTGPRRRLPRFDARRHLRARPVAAARCRTCGRPKSAAARSGTAARCLQQAGQYDQGSYGQQGGYGQPYRSGACGAAYGAAMMGGGGGSFLGTAAAAAAGVVGGSLLLNSIRSMMGGSHHGLRRHAPRRPQRRARVPGPTSPTAASPATPASTTSARSRPSRDDRIHARDSRSGSRRR